MTYHVPPHALIKNLRLQWTNGAQRSFDALKVAMTTAPILAMPTDCDDYTLDTDASDLAIGAVLSQKQDGIERVIAYASRSLDRREQNYCVTRKELLAVVHFLRHFKLCQGPSKFKRIMQHSLGSHARSNWTASVVA
jgi:RNase H-like domain found in reverse transcriptase